MKNLFLIISLFLFLKISAQTNTWDGSTDTDWHKTCNWTLDLIPTCNHDVVIPTVTNYPIVTGTAHSLSLSIISAATNALEINSGGGGILYISSSGGSCSGTATNNGGCSCNNLAYLYDSGGTDGYPECDASGPCGTFCYIAGDCSICLGGGGIPACVGDPDCNNPCGINCGGGFTIYEYN